MKHFREELDRLTYDLLGLAMAVEKSIRGALRALDERQPELAQRVIDGDGQIDREEVRIEEECVRLLVLTMPAASDLRRLIAVLKINNDLERIADLAVNIAEEARALTGDLEELPLLVTLKTMATSTLQMVSDSLNAFVGSDLALARTVIAMDDEVDRLDQAIRNESKLLVQSDSRLVGAAFRVFFVSRQLERIADHATNIAENVVYLLEGSIVRHQSGSPAGSSRDRQSHGPGAGAQ